MNKKVLRFFFCKKCLNLKLPKYSNDVSYIVFVETTVKYINREKMLFGIVDNSEVLVYFHCVYIF